MVEEKKVINSYVKESFGYLFIALLCVISGAVIHFNRTEKISEQINDPVVISILISAYLLFLFPYIINREILLERKEKPNLSNSMIISYAYQFPNYIIIGTLLLCIVLCFLGIKTNSITLLELLRLVVLFCLASIPFIVIHCRMRYLFKKNKIHKAYSFSESILIPALTLCLISFSFGWVIVSVDIDFNLMIIFICFSIIISLLIYFLDSITNTENLVKLSMLILLFLIIVYLLEFYLFNKVYYFDIILIAIILSLALGVSEAVKRIYVAKKNKRLVSKHSGVIEDYNFYFIGGTNAGVTLPLLIPLIALVNNFSIFVTFAFVTLQLMHVFWITKKDDICKNDFYISLFLGILLPLAMMIMSWIDFNVNILTKSSSVSVLAVLTSIFLGIIFIIYKSGKNFLNNLAHYKYFNISLIFIMFITGIYAYLSGSESIINLYYDLLFFSFILFVIISFFNFYGNIGKIIKEDIVSND